MEALAFAAVGVILLVIFGRLVMWMWTSTEDEIRDRFSLFPRHPLFDAYYRSLPVVCIGGCLMPLTIALLTFLDSQPSRSTWVPEVPVVAVIAVVVTMVIPVFLAVTIALFNRPRFLVSPALRHQKGLLR